MKAMCVVCRFFSPETEQRSRNECRRHSPEARRTERGRHDQHAIGIWPAVSPNGWCGEFQSRLDVPSTKSVVALVKVSQ